MCGPYFIKIVISSGPLVSWMARTEYGIMGYVLWFINVGLQSTFCSLAHVILWRGILRELWTRYESSFMFYMRFLVAPPTYESAAVTPDKQASECVSSGGRW
jgi:hypothetical protein